MKKYYKYIIMFFVILAIFLIGCSPKRIGRTEIPKENKIELEKVWEIQMDSQQANYAIEDDMLYIVSENQVVYIVDINTGKILKSFKANVNEEDGISCAGIAVYNGILAINYESKLIVIDTKTEKVLLEHKQANELIVAIGYNILMYEDLVIFSNLIKDKIFAINYNTGKISWEYGEEVRNRTNFYLSKYKDRYLYINRAERAYYQFNPLTGEILNKYPIKSAGGIENTDQSFYIPKFDNIKDKDFEAWLIDKSFDVFNLTKKGYIYTTYKQNFYFHGTDSKLEWVIRIPNKINITYQYGRYSFLNLYNSASLLDLENKEILWNIDFKIASPPRAFIHEERLYLPGVDGRFVVYDLSKLEK